LEESICGGSRDKRETADGVAGPWRGEEDREENLERWLESWSQGSDAPLYLADLASK